MNFTKKYCESKYYNQFDTSTLLNEVAGQINPTIKKLEREFQYLFYKMLHTDPCAYWNKTVYTQTSLLLDDLFQNFGQKLEVEDTVFNYFLMGTNAYSEISETIYDLKNFNLSSEIKTRLYRLPTYTAILESCLSNFLRIIAVLTGKGIGKDYTTQNTLGQLLEVINSNGYTEIACKVNVNLRNAINHGKVLMKKEAVDRICFFYVENRISKSEEMNLYEFDQIIDETFDTVSAVFLALITFFNNHIDLIKIKQSQKEYVSFAFFAMRLSLPNLYCKYISDTGNSKQLNIEIVIQNPDRGYIGQIATMLSILIYDRYNDYEQYMISFSYPRMINSWIRFGNQEIFDMSNKIREIDDVMRAVIERKDFVIFPPATEEIDLNEAKYFCFPNYTSDNYKINNVRDASTLDRKRINANLYIGDISEREEILKIIYEATEWLSNLKNPPSPVTDQKHGDMPADSVYLNVYINDSRKSKELIPSNENFVCFVDYNSNGKTTLKNGGMLKSVWTALYHEKIENFDIAWRNGKYFTRRNVKVSRNGLCPCGSGLKYKKCCGMTE